MKKVFVTVIVLIILFSSLLFVTATNAQFRNLQIKFRNGSDMPLESLTPTPTPSAMVYNNYLIHGYDTNILLEKDRSLLITEKLQVEFYSLKHGIFRVIPDAYKINNKVLITPLSVISVTDEKGTAIPFAKSSYNQSVKLKIGDPDRTFMGRKTYVITYRLKRILQDFPENEEIYWNVTGHEWDTGIEKISATIESPYAKIVKTSCFAGNFGSKETNCEQDNQGKNAIFNSGISLNPGQDFTIITGIDKNNQLTPVSYIENIYYYLLDNWGYLIAIFPLLFSLFLWWSFGRDKTYLFGNVFYKPQNTKEVSDHPFSRPHLPMVYGPIDGLTPAQVGAIFDERVDMQDIVAEIIELARLKMLNIEKIEKKKLFGTSTDYIFTKMNGSLSKLQPYQKTIYNKIFSTKDTVKLSELKNKFYSALDDIKKEIYESLIKGDIFPNNPTTSKNLWTVVYIALNILCYILVMSYSNKTEVFLPIPILLLGGLAGLFFARSMGRRTAWGHSLYRQTVGLRWYLNKGKWREEIAEKNLFFEEILPLAISLGVVEKLTKDMKDLGVQPPDYFTAVSMNTFSRDLNSFSSTASSNLRSSPSGSSSYSGSSGFSGGGSSGGGFGGGGGGSW